MRRLRLEAQHGGLQVDRAVEQQFADVVGVRGGVRLLELRAVALAVEDQPVRAQPAPELLEVLDRLPGAVEAGVGGGDPGLGEAGGGEVAGVGGERVAGLRPGRGVDGRRGRDGAVQRKGFDRPIPRWSKKTTS